MSLLLHMAQCDSWSGLQNGVSTVVSTQASVGGLNVLFDLDIFEKLQFQNFEKIVMLLLNIYTATLCVEALIYWENLSVLLCTVLCARGRFGSLHGKSFIVVSTACSFCSTNLTKFRKGSGKHTAPPPPPPPPIFSSEGFEFLLYQFTG
jgi:hypothetical protein